MFEREMFVSVPREIFSFSLSDQNNGAVIYKVTGLHGCLCYETYVTGLKEEVLA